MATEKFNESVPEEQVSTNAEDVNLSPNAEQSAATNESDASTACQTESDSVAQTSSAAEVEPVEEKPVEVEPAAAIEVPAEPTAEPVLAEEPVEQSEPATEPAAKLAEDEESGPKGVDFEEEEAILAASSADLEIEDEQQDGDEEEVEQVNETIEKTMLNYSSLSKSELVDRFAALLDERPVQLLRYDIEAIKISFYKQHRAFNEQLKKQFVEQGGLAEEFVAPADSDEIKLKELFAEYRKRREAYMANLEHTKEDNLKIKLKIIDDLKELINSSETMNHTFNLFRELQQRWRETGPVPQANVKELWETYNLHVENFYNYIKINKELRDLDLKRNYEAKLQLCEAAEALIMEPSIVIAFRKLQELHEQWRETGPVANEYKEVLWERFKEASSRINKQHQDYFEGVKQEQRRNLDLKTELCVKAEELAGEILTSRKEWNRASDKLIEIQKVWKTIGFAPKHDNTRVYERFRIACDHFFELKRAFYEQFKAEMEHNLQLKIEICEAAESLRESTQWKKTTDELIALQKRWKEVGPVARRHSDAIWKRFRSACDSFFEHKASHFSGVDIEHEQNLKLKEALLDEIEACEVENGGFDMIKDFQRRWSEIGYVPIKDKNAIQARYKAQIDRLFSALRSGAHDRNMDRFRSKISSIKSGGGDKKLRFERDRLYNKVKQLESDIALLENNIGFFSKSKNAEAMINDVKEKIRQAKVDMAETIEKINLIDSNNQQ